MPATEQRPLALDISTMGEIMGIKPKKDPENGLWFYLWDDMFSVDDNGTPKPNFGAQEAAKIFFGKGPDWLRWRYRSAANHPDGYFVLGNKILEPKRTESNQRYYTLADIERMAHALAQNDAIDGGQVVNAITLALLIARTYGIV